MRRNETNEHNGQDCHAVSLDYRLLEPEVGQADRLPRFVADEKWNSAEVHQLLALICEHVFRQPSVIKVSDVDDHSSYVEIEVSQREPSAVVEPIRKALEILFAAIGPANGRVLKLDILYEDQHVKADLNRMLE